MGVKVHGIRFRGILGPDTPSRDCPPDRPSISFTYRSVGAYRESQNGLNFSCVRAYAMSRVSAELMGFREVSAGAE